MQVLCFPTTGDQEPVIALRVRKLVSIRTYGMEWSPMFSIWVPTRKGGDGLEEKEARPIHLSCRTSLFLRPGTRDLPVSAESDRSNKRRTGKTNSLQQLQRVSMGPKHSAISRFKETAVTLRSTISALCLAPPTRFLQRW